MTRADWVYRGYEYDIQNAPVTDQAPTYTNLSRDGLPFQIQVGSPAGLILYDSHTYLMQGVKVDNPASGFLAFLGREARAEHGSVTIHAVEGTLYLQPTTWALGANFLVAARIIICQQDPASGAILLPATYTICGGSLGGAGIEADAAVYANGWGNLQTRILRQAFATENDMSRFQMRFKWRGRRKLRGELCLALFVETIGPGVGSVNMDIGPVFRTLVTDSSS